MQNPRKIQQPHPVRLRARCLLLEFLLLPQLGCWGEQQVVLFPPLLSSLPVLFLPHLRLQALLLPQLGLLEQTVWGLAAHWKQPRTNQNRAGCGGPTACRCRCCCCCRLQPPAVLALAAELCAMAMPCFGMQPKRVLSAASGQMAMALPLSVSPTSFSLLRSGWLMMLPSARRNRHASSTNLQELASPPPFGCTRIRR